MHLRRGFCLSLMTFLTSIILGLAMGSGTVFSIRFGQKDRVGLKENILASFALLGAVTVVLNIAVFAGTDLILRFLRTPQELVGMMREYLLVIFRRAFGDLPLQFLCFGSAGAGELRCTAGIPRRFLRF